MDKTLAGLLGAVGAMVASTAGHAAPANHVLQAASYADLLRPIQNPVETLKALDAAEAPQAGVEEVQFYPPVVILRDHHHHHHHHRYYRRYHHHHHHHHHHDYYRR